MNRARALYRDLTVIPNEDGVPELACRIRSAACFHGGGAELRPGVCGRRGPLRHGGTGVAAAPCPDRARTGSGRPDGHQPQVIADSWPTRSPPPVELVPWSLFSGCAGGGAPGWRRVVPGGGKAAVDRPPGRRRGPGLPVGHGPDGGDGGLPPDRDFGPWLSGGNRVCNPTFSSQQRKAAVKAPPKMGFLIIRPQALHLILHAGQIELQLLARSWGRSPGRPSSTDSSEVDGLLAGGAGWWRSSLVLIRTSYS